MNFFMVIPKNRSFGGIAEKFLFILAYAQKTGKKAWIIQEHNCLSGKSTINKNFNDFFYKLEHEHILKLSKIMKIISCCIGCFYFFYRQLLIKIQRKVDLYNHWNDNISRIGIKNLGLGNDTDISIFQEKFSASFWSDFFNNVNMNFPNEYTLVWEHLKKDLGLPPHAWYVCLHVRSSLYYNDNHVEVNNIRNADIQTYAEAINYIGKKGGYVIRIGDKGMPTINSPYFIDYPNTSYKSMWADFFLVKNCKFMIGTNSGGTQIAFLFSKPVLLVNTTDLLTWLSLTKKSMVIFKPIKDKQLNRILTLEETYGIDYDTMYHSTHYGYSNKFSTRYEFINNSSEEILMATKEMFTKIDVNEFIETNLQKQYKIMIKKYIYDFYVKKQIPEKIFNIPYLMGDGIIVESFIKKYSSRFDQPIKD